MSDTQMAWGLIAALILAAWKLIELFGWCFSTAWHHYAN